MDPKSFPKQRRPDPLLALCLLPTLALCACGAGENAPPTDPGSRAEAVVAVLQNCTSLTIRGTPVEGRACGGTTHAGQCSPGLLYRCRKNTTTNNCTLDQSCFPGCLTNPFGPLADACFAGARPLTLSATSVPGGSEVIATVTLADAHPGGVIINMHIDRSDLVSARIDCNISPMPAGVTTVTFPLPTAVVSAPTDVTIYANLAYTDGGGVSRQLVSLPVTLTLMPGGTQPPPPPLVSFTLTPSTIAPGGVSFMNVVLQHLAPVAGVRIAATSSNPSVAAVIPGGQPFVFGGCTRGGGAATLQAANQIAQTTVVTVSASSGAAGQAPLTNPLTVASGCTPKTCLDLAPPACSGPNGCGGTLACGCNGGQTCGGCGTPGVCCLVASSGVSSLSVAPSTVTSGGSSTGTVGLSLAAPAGGLGVFLSSSSAAASVPQSIVIPAGQTSGTFTVTTSAVSATTAATITAASNGSASAVLTVSPGGAGCTPTTCAAQGKNCGTLANGCGGTLNCGACLAPQTCGGGGVANVCGGGTGTTSLLTVTATGRSGEQVFSTPTGLTVSVGATGSASFATGTSVSLSVSNGRDAIWSGACSSGGAKQKSCALKLNAAASVTASVQ